MDKNAQIFLGLAVIGGAAFYFVSKTESSKKQTKDNVDVPAPPSGNNTPVAKKVNVTGAVANALKDNENPFVYNGKIVLLNNLLQLSKFQPFVDRYTTTYLARFYTLWKGQRVEKNELPYGEVVNKGNIDRYILDLYSAGAKIREKLA